MDLVFEARYPGTCLACSARWQRGDAIRLGYDPQRPADRRAVWLHAECPAEPDPTTVPDWYADAAEEATWD